MYSVPPVNFLYFSYKITAHFVDDIGNSRGCVGTGFFVAEGTNYALITNRHVVDPNYQVKSAHPSTRLVDLRVLGKGRQGDTFELSLKPDQEIYVATIYQDDVACIVNPLLAEGSATGDVFYHFGIEALADDYFFSEAIYPGERIFYAGFPDPHDKLAQRPILRVGTIASDPRHPYSYSGNDEGSRIAYEGFSSPGASGSAVWAASRGFENYPGYRAGALVGVNSGHIEAKYGAHSGISYFYKSSILIDILSRHGMKRSFN